jgi:hypothetical protein
VAQECYKKVLSAVVCLLSGSWELEEFGGLTSETVGRSVCRGKHVVKHVKAAFTIALRNHPRLLQEVFRDLHQQHGSKHIWWGRIEWSNPMQFSIDGDGALTLEPLTDPRESNINCVYFPKRLELLFITVCAFPKASSSGFTCRV